MPYWNFHPTKDVAVVKVGGGMGFHFFSVHSCCIMKGKEEVLE